MESASKKEPSNKQPPSISRAGSGSLGGSEKDLRNTLRRSGSFKAHSQSTPSIQLPKDPEKYDAYPVTAAASNTQEATSSTSNVENNTTVQSKETVSVSAPASALAPQTPRSSSQKSLLSTLLKPGDDPVPSPPSTTASATTTEDKKETLPVPAPLEVRVSEDFQRPAAVDTENLSSTRTSSSTADMLKAAYPMSPAFGKTDNVFEQNAKLIRGSNANKSPLEDDIEKLNNSVLVLQANIPPPPFANMSSCDNCREDVGTLLGKGRHHCRNCGGSFCGDCSSKSIAVPYQVYVGKGEQRVCDSCHNRIKDFHTQAQTTNVTWNGLTPPTNEEFLIEFNLPATQSPISIFNCCYFTDCVPFYGHMFLCREFICFKGYKTHKLKLACMDVSTLIKPEFYYINALQVKTKTDQKYFFAEFNGLRDLCFLRLDQLIRASQEGVKLQDDTLAVSPEALAQQALVRRKSYRLLAGSGIVPFSSISRTCSTINEDGSELEKQLNPTIVEETEAELEHFQPLPPDQPIKKMTSLVDCELHADVKDVFEFLWSDGNGKEFLTDVMVSSKDIDIQIGKWDVITCLNEAEINKGFVISKEEYERYRRISYSHPPKTSFPGLPPYAECHRIQRFRMEGAKNTWNRFIISDLQRMVKIPFCDYFEIETRYVFSRDGKDFCHVQIGLVVNFLKSTWFKSQINSSTISESKESQELWAKSALTYLTTHKNKVALAAAAAAAVKKPSAPSETGSVKTTEPSATAPVVTAATATATATAKAETRQVKITTVTSTAGATTIPSTTTLVDEKHAFFQFWLLAFVLLVVLYLLFIVQRQQKHLEQLTNTTNLLLSQLEQKDDGPQEICKKKMLDEALEKLRQFFRSTCSA